MGNLYSIKEAAKKMGIGYHTLREIVKNNQISFITINKSKVISDKDIEEFYEKNRTSAK